MKTGVIYARYSSDTQTEQSIAGRERKAKALKINLKKVSGNKQDKVFAIYFKNVLGNKSETDFSERAIFARIHKKKSPCSY